VLVSNISSINFKGIAVGNGLHSNSDNDNSLMYFAKYHGLMDQGLWNDLLTSCQCSDPAIKLCNFDAASAKIPLCSSKYGTAQNLLNNLDVYNLYLPCFGGVPQSPNSPFKKVPIANPFELALLQPAFRIKGTSGNNQKDYSRPRSRTLWLKDTPPCSNATAIITYMNFPEVRTALHINSNLPEYDVCDEKLIYNTLYENMSMQYIYLTTKTKIRILIYNGDVDMACNFLGAQFFFDNLAYPEDAAYKQWFFKSSDGTKQVGGFGKTYKTPGNPLTLITVRGSGHMVPQDRPVAALSFIERFLANQPIIAK